MTENTEIRFHGTSGWFDNEIGCTSCISLPFKSSLLIFDVGTGIRRIDTEAIRGKRVIIFLSHLHLDHSVGFHFLQRFRPQSVTIVVPSDLVAHLQALLAPPYTGGFERSPFPVTVEGIHPGENRTGSLQFCAYKLLHSTSVFGYRIEIEGKVFSYCVDTRPCPELYDAAREADVFVCDCGLYPDQDSNLRHHMTPGEAILVASKAGAKRLVLTHFGCTRYTTEEVKLGVLTLSEQFDGQLLVAHDGMRITL